MTNRPNTGLYLPTPRLDSPARHALNSWLEEKRSAYLNRVVSDLESGTPRQFLFLAQAAEAQAGLWAAEMRR